MVYVTLSLARSLLLATECDHWCLADPAWVRLACRAVQALGTNNRQRRGGGIWRALRMEIARASFCFAHSDLRRKVRVVRKLNWAGDEPARKWAADICASIYTRATAKDDGGRMDPWAA